MQATISVCSGVELRAPRRFPIYRPYWDERPTHLLARDILSEIELDWIRIAKDDGKVVAAYEVVQNDAWNFSVLSLQVAESHRRQGLGRWMLLHAVGLIESKGGRVVHARCRNLKQLFKNNGFSEIEPNHYVLELQPE